MDDEAAFAIGARLAELYAQIHRGSMRDMPVSNNALGVEAIGFRPWGEMAIGVMVTPWFMNLVAADVSKTASMCLAPGARCCLTVPAGEVEFVCGWLEGFGPIRSCSLFSPMCDFPDTDAARDVAREAIGALFNPALQAESAVPMDRRSLLRGRFGGDRGMRP